MTEKMKETVNGTRAYSLNFYVWKKASQLRSSLLAYSNKSCPRCKIAIRKDQFEKGKSISYFCYNCQLLFRK